MKISRKRLLKKAKHKGSFMILTMATSVISCDTDTDSTNSMKLPLSSSTVTLSKTQYISARYYRCYMTHTHERTTITYAYLSSNSPARTSGRTMRGAFIGSLVATRASARHCRTASRRWCTDKGFRTVQSLLGNIAFFTPSVFLSEDEGSSILPRTHNDRVAVDSRVQLFFKAVPRHLWHRNHDAPRNLASVALYNLHPSL